MNSSPQPANFDVKIEASFWLVLEDDTGELAAFHCDPMIFLADGNCMTGEEVLMVGGKEKVFGQAVLSKI